MSDCEWDTVNDLFNSGDVGRFDAFPVAATDRAYEQLQFLSAQMSDLKQMVEADRLERMQQQQHFQLFEQNVGMMLEQLRQDQVCLQHIY